MKEPDDQDTSDGGRSGSRNEGKLAHKSILKSSQDTTADSYTDGEESYLGDDLDLDDMDESSHSSQEYVQAPAPSQEPPVEVKEEPEADVKKVLSETFYYDYPELVSIPYVSSEERIPLYFLTLNHSFGYDCRKRANLQLLDSNTLLYVAGNQMVLLDFKDKTQIYLQSSSGQGIGAIGVHPKKTYFAVAEKGSFPKIIIYEYPSLKPYRILRDGAEKAYAYVDFNNEGNLLASVGCHPDYTITIWGWKEEQPILRTKAFSQDVFKVTFNPDNDEQLTTSGSGHIKFWEMAFTFTGLKLQGSLGRFGKTSTSDIEGYAELPDGKVLSGSEWGNLLLWEGSLIKVELCRTGMKSCHSGSINQIMLDEGEVITAGSDGSVRKEASHGYQPNMTYQVEPWKESIQSFTNEDEESEESSEEESSLESDEDASGSEDDVFDDSICPTNCDVSLFELALQLREKRLDIEEALVEEKKIVDNLKKEYDTISKKVKVVATNLNAAEEALEAYQREKQQRLNELLVVIPLKLHQIEYMEFGEVPEDLSGTLVFSNHSLDRLQERIVQLQEENAKQQKLNKECRERRKLLIREKREMAKTISKMEETVRELMISKFGRVIDLEALQTLSVNTTLEELKIKKLRKELSNAKELRMWEEKIAQVRWDLMMKTKEHTKKLHQMNDLCLEKKKLDSRLNTLQNQQGNAFQGLRKADIVAKQKVTELVQTQLEKITALKEEIELLRKKGGLLLPPITPKPKNEMKPMDT